MFYSKGHSSLQIVVPSREVYDWKVTPYVGYCSICSFFNEYIIPDWIYINNEKTLQLPRIKNDQIDFSVRIIMI